MFFFVFFLFNRNYDEQFSIVYVTLLQIFWTTDCILFLDIIMIIKAKASLICILHVTNIFFIINMTNILRFTYKMYIVMKKKNVFVEVN